MKKVLLQPPPNISKNALNRAGDLLSKGIACEFSEDEALKIINEWRSAHAVPINTFQSTLRKRVTGIDDALVAQRLKRMPTIIHKLQRYSDMQLARMQDIGGLRAILPTPRDVQSIAQKYRNVDLMEHELVREIDHINNPRDTDGYRSIHLIYRYKNINHPEYDGLFVELQLRTRLQHLWATAVETVGAITGEGLKFRAGSADMLDFFALVSSVFGIEEGIGTLKKHSSITQQELLTELKKMWVEGEIMDRVKGISMAAEMAANTETKYYFHVIFLNKDKKQVQVFSFGRNEFANARKKLEDIEKQVFNENVNADILLASAGPIETLKRAYPSFFLDVKDFATKIEELAS